jgi:hypothetical protein
MEKIKLFWESDKGKDILVIIIIILVGLGSFELGRLSKKANSDLKIEYPDQEATAVSSLDENSNIPANIKKINSGNYFASSRGTKYYSLGCSAGKTIKEENRIYFDTSIKAQEAGYELSSACR